VWSVNMVEIFCTHVWKWKNEICWNYSRNASSELKENYRGGEILYDTL
jgi:hypothetical protein